MQRITDDYGRAAEVGMAGSMEKAKIPGRLLLAFLKQQYKNAVGDEITDELGDIGAELLGESLPA